MGFPDLAILVMQGIVDYYIIIMVVSLLVTLRFGYCFDDPNQQPPDFTIKGTAFSEYWLYEYSPISKAFQSRPLIPLRQRPLFADKRIVVFAKSRVRFILTSDHGVHNWDIPSLGIRCNAVPGCIAQKTIYFQEPGRYYGISSTGAANEPDKGMPFVIEVLPFLEYFCWMIKSTRPGAEPVLINARNFPIPFPTGSICNSVFSERPPTGGSFRRWASLGDSAFRVPYKK